MELLDEQPKGKQDFDQWISNGVVLSKGKELKLLHHLCFVYLQYIHQQIIIFFFHFISFFSVTKFHVQQYTNGNDRRKCIQTQTIQFQEKY